ncbi:MAG: hydrogenase nickel incorporation protein HypB [Bacteroidales bacterium]|nr:hydrogenase nickel incorporation protein HypB [Bacteroidales bacterium]
MKMNEFQVLEIKKNIYEENEIQARELREQLKKDNVFLMNLMSSPGSGKTTTVIKTIEALREKLKIGIMEADIDSDVDAKKVAESGTSVIQLHTGGMCHLDATMTKQGIEALGSNDLDLIILENIGNLICTASYDVGANKNVMLLSVPEGDDKPLKYPKMFKMVDVLLVNKMDTISMFDFNLQALEEHVLKMNPGIKIIPISAKTGQGIDIWADWLLKQVQTSNP